MKLVGLPLARINEQEETLMRKWKLALALVVSFVSMGCGLEAEGEVIEGEENLGSVFAGAQRHLAQHIAGASDAR